MAAKLMPPLGDDRVLAAVLHAPVVEASHDEIVAFEEGLADIRAGRTVSGEKVRARLAKQTR